MSDVIDWAKLSADDHRILYLLAQDKRYEDVAAAGVGGTANWLRQTRLPRIRSLLGFATTHGLLTAYSNWLGQRGMLVPPRPYSSAREPFRLGGAVWDADLVSRNLGNPREVRCFISNSAYEPPAEFADRIPEIRQDFIDYANAKKILHYERGEIFVVSDIRFPDEMRSSLDLTLTRTKYYTARGLCLKIHSEKIPPGDFTPSNPSPYQLPLTLGVGLTVVIGDPPQVVIAERSELLDINSGSLSSPCSGFGESPRDEDILGLDNRRIFNFKQCMAREFEEETGAVYDWIIRRIWLTALIFDYTNLHYDILGYVWIPPRFGIPPQSLCDRLNRAHEHKSFRLEPYPKKDQRGNLSESEREKLKNLCQSLINHKWSSTGGLGLTALLIKDFGDDTYELLGAPRRDPGFVAQQRQLTEGEQSS